MPVMRTQRASRMWWHAVVALVTVGTLGLGSLALRERGDPAPVARLFAPTSWWNAALADDAPLDPRSPQLVAELRSQVGRDGAWINTAEFSAPIYTVDAGQPGVPVSIDRPHDMFTNDADAAVLERQLAAVPIPRRARPAPGTDGHLVVWQPATDTMWELWQAHEVPRDACRWHRDDARGWHASWGARIDRVSRNPGVNPHPFGATASGLPFAAGLMRLDELRVGRIDHALAMAIPATALGRMRAPANRTDGADPRPEAIPEGTRFRLDPTVDVDALALPPLARMMAVAAQRYGIIVRDRAGAVAFYGEQPLAATGDPYPALFGGQWPSRVLARFPWHRLQALAGDMIEGSVRITPYSAP